MITILDCYTDEPAGLGVPPYIGTYPRYIYGYFLDKGEDVKYITIDDLRLFYFYNDSLKRKQKTDIKVNNLSSNHDNLNEIVKNTSKLIVIVGVHTPGKYLSAIPGTLKEVSQLVSIFNCEKILTGPAVFGTSVEGGKFSEKADLSIYSEIEQFNFSYQEIKKYSVIGASVIKQIPDLRIVELELGRGCSRQKGCSFCTEPLKNRLQFRDMSDLLLEIDKFYEIGIRDFRIGKQSCYYSYPDAERILYEIRKKYNDLRTLHIDNVNPVNVLSNRGRKITESIVNNCTSGNVAAFGVESFDKKVIEENNLNCDYDSIFEAVSVINELGRELGDNGLPKFLPGINLLFGLRGESKKTHEENMKGLRKIMDDGMLLRRINIRQVNIFEGTDLFNTTGNKFLKKNSKYYWKWRNDVRQNIDFPMLKKIAPIGSVMKNVRSEVHDGNHTFCRQIGTYPLIVGINKRVELNKFFDIKVTGHMLRSITGEII